MKAQRLISLDNPVIRDHRVLGQHVLPGLAYIDLLFQVFRKHGYDYRALELRNVSIYQPLIVSQGNNVLLDIQCTEEEGGHWRIVVDGRVQRAGEVIEDSTRYITATMLQVETVEFDEAIDIGRVIESTTEVLTAKVLYAGYREKELIHDAFMTAQGQVYVSDVAVHVECEVSEAAAASAGELMFHPALIDGSAVCGGGALASLNHGQERQLSLPLFYESFRACELLQRRCTTRIQRALLNRTQELSYCTLEFFNAAGQKVAELKNFAGKLIRDPALLDPSRTSSMPVKRLSTAEQKQARSVRPAQPDIELFLRQLLADKLQQPLDYIDPTVGYYELGIQSAGLLELVQAIEAKIGATLSPTLLFEYVTIAQLSAHLAEHYADELTVMERNAECATEDSMSSLSDKVVAAKSIDQLAVVSSPTRLASAVAAPEAIAIIGMAGRFPAARNIGEFWKNLKIGKDCVTEIPLSRWDWHRFDSLRSPSGKPMSRWGGFLDDVECFDPQFFRISPREAESLDPQERLFLETSWEAIEDAGYTPLTLVTARGVTARRAVGVFAGVMHKDYALIANEAQFAGHSAEVLQSNASIANRVSYYCNFHGPSMVIDTVCSSSLIAVHLASQSLRLGECEVALAGGVNLSLHPVKYLAYGMMDMLASDGRCHTFGARGDGYVSSEAVGAVLLKPLSQAVAGGDHIYAVIKSSGTNHVGTVSGFTVPSPVAQADLIASCLEQAQIEPRSISYVEAHGTGTSLGDPIEMAGLSKAFAQFTQDTQFCAIGSVKSNIGHAESAAGLCGLIKVALQLHRRTLVPSLHSRELNPHIDWQRTPFVVQQEQQPWLRPTVTENGREVSYPRRAALSSFGATGANAHLILEEVTDGAPAELNPSGLSGHQSFLVPLSARTEERLREYAERLLTFLKDGALDVASEAEPLADRNALNLASIAYTLQVGRKEMDTRVAFIADSVAALIEKLAAFAQGKNQVAGCYYKRAIDRDNATIAADEDFTVLLQTWIRKKKLQSIAQVWVAGSDIDWNRLYKSGRPCRASLPTYPFAKEKYWIAKGATTSSTSLDRPERAWNHLLHPLLHANTSDLDEQRFTSTFSGEEFFLRDHRVGGHRVLPGVCYLEMACAAVARSVGLGTGLQGGVRLQNVVWSPLEVSQPKEMRLGLYHNEQGEIEFEIYSAAAQTPAVQGAAGLWGDFPGDGANAEEAIYAQGRAVLLSTAPAEQIDLSAFRMRCDRSIDVGECYGAFAAMGIEYGSAHRGLTRLQVGKDSEGQGFVLAQVQLPQCVRHTEDEYVLHPSVLESALQASLGLLPDTLRPAGSEGASPAVLPFALERLEILNRTPRVAMVVVRSSEARKVARPMENELAKGGAQELDIDICDELGRVCVRFKGLRSRASAGKEGDGDGSGLSMLRSASAVPVKSDLREETTQYLKRLLASTLKLTPERIESDVELERYGIDSILALKLVNELEGAFGSLPKTLLFEYQSIEALAGYFVDGYRDTLVAQLKRTDRAPLMQSTPTPVVERLRRRSRIASPSARARPDGESVRAVHDIAIIGVSGRYPGANSVAKFWENLKAGKDCITEIPQERWDYREHFDTEKGKVGKSYSKWGGFIDVEPAHDDRNNREHAHAAGSLTREAQTFFQIVLDLLARSGFSNESFSKRFMRNVGVYLGAVAGGSGEMPAAAIANLLSNVLGLRGPSVAIDTMSASSLTALHMACEGLARGDCEAAIVGGIHVLRASDYEVMSRTSMLGSSARSRSFTAGDGLIPAEAMVAVMVVPLSRAIANNDNILAVIKSTAMNHAGTINPNLSALCKSIEDTFVKSGISPESIGYVEAGANGSPVIDALEVKALTKIFRDSGTPLGSCPIGSVKSNIGHAIGASGLTQLTKALLQMMHKQIVPSIMADTLNKDIDFAQSAFYLSTELSEWSRLKTDESDERVTTPRRAIVNSFGAGGCYVHVILEESPQTNIDDGGRQGDIGAERGHLECDKSELDLEIHLRQNENIIDAVEWNVN